MNRDVTDIAKDIRKDIKAAIKDGELPAGKYSVRIARYSMGRSLSVCLCGLKEERLILNPMRIQYERENPHQCIGNLPAGAPAVDRLSDFGGLVMDALEAIVNAYHVDKSDSQSDYYNVNFAKHVTFSGTLERAQRDWINGQAENGVIVREKNQLRVVK